MEKEPTKKIKMKVIFYTLTKVLKAEVCFFLGGVLISVFLIYLPMTSRVHFSSWLLLLSGVAVIASYILGGIREKIDIKYALLNKGQEDELEASARKANWRSAADWNKKFRPTLVIVSYVVLIAGVGLLMILMIQNHNTEPACSELLEKEKQNAGKWEEKADSLKDRLHHIYDSLNRVQHPLPVSDTVH